MAASNYADGAVAVDWLASDYEIFCYIAYTAARAAGRRGPLTPEMAARWWLDLYRAGRQSPWLERAERELLRQERTDLGIAVGPGWPANDDSWSGVVAGLSPQTPPRPMIGPTAGAGLVTDFDRMAKRLLAREAAASAVVCKPASPTPPLSGARCADVTPEVKPRLPRSPRLSPLVKAVAAAAAWLIANEQLKHFTVYRLKKSVGTQLQSEPCEGIDGINSDSKTVDELLKVMLNYNKRLYENS